MTSIRDEREARSKREANCSATCLAVDARLGPVELLDAFATVFLEFGDELARVHVRHSSGKKTTLSTDNARQMFAENPDFADLWLTPRSEAKKAKANWETSGIVFNGVPTSRTIFLGLPAARYGKSSTYHLRLWKVLATFLEPTYGFGYLRQYGLGPEYFAAGWQFAAEGLSPNAADIRRIETWCVERSGKPADHPQRYRHERGMILDVFPANLLSEQHLARTIDGQPFESWARAFTGEESLVDVGRGLVAWFVPTGLIPRARQVLRSSKIILTHWAAG